MISAMSLLRLQIVSDRSHPDVQHPAVGRAQVRGRRRALEAPRTAFVVSLSRAPAPCSDHIGIDAKPKASFFMPRPNHLGTAMSALSAAVARRSCSAATATTASSS